MIRRLLRALSRRRASWLGVVGGLLIAAPALGTGWFNDDFAQRLVLERAVPDYPLEPWQLYEFTPPAAPTPVVVEQGYLPWFTDPELSMRFFRPLSSLTMAADHALFGRSALAAHLSSFAWLFALLVLVSRLHRRVLRAPEAAIATLVYGIAPGHAMAASWVAARHGLVGGSFAVLAILLHLAWRQDRRPGFGVGAIAALLAGLLASEITLGAVVFIALYEGLVRDDAWRARLRAAAPTVGLALGYLAFYALGGYGVRQSATYLSPLEDPGGYALAALERLPVLLGEALGALPSEIWGSVVEGRAVLVGWGLVATALVFGVIRWRRPRGARWRRELWLLASALLALAPVLGGFLGGRLLVVAGVGTSGLLGVAIVRALAIGGEAGLHRWVARLALAALVVLHLGLAPLGRLGLQAAFFQLSQAERAHVVGLDLAACGDADRLYSLTGSDPSNSMYLGAGLSFYAPPGTARLGGYRALSMTPSDQRFTRLDERTFTLEVVGDRGASALEDVHRAAPLAVGEAVTVGELTARVTDAGPGGWRAARFEVDGGLDRVCFASWDGTALTTWRAPPVGEVVELPFRPGLMGM